LVSLLGCGSGCDFVLQYGAKLLAKFGAVFVSMNGAGVQRGEIQILAFGPIWSLGGKCAQVLLPLRTTVNPISASLAVEVFSMFVAQALADGFRVHRRVLTRLENFLLYSIFELLTSRDSCMVMVMIGYAPF
jgi:hypothetical protein